jgi:MFS-type transporter involved in bile tolerance (Atg22 family)
MNRRPFFIWLTLIAVVLLVVMARSAHNEPLILVDATPAATTLCTKAAPVCDEACVRLTVTRRLT